MRTTAASLEESVGVKRSKECTVSVSFSITEGGAVSRSSLSVEGPGRPGGSAFDSERSKEYHIGQGK